MAELAVAKKLIEVIKSEATQKFFQMWNYTSELKDLEKTIKAINNMLLDAHNKPELTNSVQDFVEELKIAVYEADDLFDELRTLDELDQLDNKQDHTFFEKVRLFFEKQDHTFFEKVLLFCLFCSKKVTQAYRMSERVKEIKKQLESVSSNHKNYKLNLKEIPDRQTKEETSSLLTERVMGREDDKNAVIKMLQDPAEDVLFLTIVGVGGIGKTTLAKLVYNDTRFSKFTKLWVCVSDEDGKKFCAKAILRSILEVLHGGKHFESGWKLDALQREIIEKLEGKKFLLVLDDVWNEDRKEWLDLEKFLKYCAKTTAGSRILITTRSKKTAEVIGNNIAYSLEGLSPKDSWNLFEIMAFDKGREHRDYPDLVALGEEIVKKCYNVPLAIVLIGSLLYSQEISVWRTFQESGWSEIGDGDNKIMPILKFSYYNLKHSLKSCFSYCALFPKDTRIEKEMLISLWIAQGYIVPSNESGSIEKAAEEHFRTLLQRCFFQDVQKNEYGEVKSIKIHDLMHDLALEVGSGEISVPSCKTSYVGYKVRHVTYVDGVSPENFVFKSKIRSFFYYSNEFPLMNTQLILSSQLIDGWMFLRVLDLEDSKLKILPDCIGKLLHLRYLNLFRNYQLATLPSSITNLHNLQTLMLRWCSQLTELPKELGKLVNLRHLDVSDCFELKSMPPGMEKLSNLRVLPYFVVGIKGSEEQCGGALKDLKSFTDIRGSIYIKIHGNYRNVEGMNDREGGYLKSAKYLTQLKVEFNNLLNDADGELDGVVLEKLEPNSNLKEFILGGYKGKILPRWGTAQSDWAISFPSLVNIKLNCCWELEQIPSLCKLPLLKSLALMGLAVEYMENASNITGSYRDDSITFFPSLESLELRLMSKLKGWQGGGDDDGQILSRKLKFPRLSHLALYDCSCLTSLTSFPLCPVLETLKLVGSGHMLQRIVDTPEMEEGSIGISNDNEFRGLKELVIDSVDTLKSIFINHQSSTSEDDDFPWKTFKSLRYLQFENLQDAHLPIAANDAKHLTFLHTLRFERCWKLEALPEWIGNLSSLQSLSISGCTALKSLPESMRKLTSLQTLEIEGCPILKERCQETNGEDWTKIQHIRNIKIPGTSPSVLSNLLYKFRSPPRVDRQLIITSIPIHL